MFDTNKIYQYLIGPQVPCKGFRDSSIELNQNVTMGRIKESLRGRGTGYVTPRHVSVNLMGSKCRKWVYGTRQYPNYKNKG